MTVRPELIGKRFGRLVVASLSDKQINNRLAWECLCDCGAITYALTNCLTAKKKRSCGCLANELAAKRGRRRFTTHGKSLTRPPEYEAWRSMVKRCVNPNYKQWKDYGGRGITVCNRWINSFENFYEDMGDRPDNLSLERINNDEGYFPENCKWATRKEQRANQRPRTKRAA